MPGVLDSFSSLWTLILPLPGWSWEGRPKPLRRSKKDFSFKILRKGRTLTGLQCVRSGQIRKSRGWEWVLWKFQKEGSVTCCYSEEVGEAAICTITCHHGREEESLGGPGRDNERTAQMGHLSLLLRASWSDLATQSHYAAREPGSVIWWYSRQMGSKKHPASGIDDLYSCHMLRAKDWEFTEAKTPFSFPALCK